MKYFNFLLTFVIASSLSFLYNRPIDTLPPIGKFFSPYHGFWKNAEIKSELKSEKINLSLLNKTVTIQYDSLLIPHIFAETEHDLYFAQGFVTAKYRLWQMEFQTHAAAGRVSEVVGAGKSDKVLSFDITQRRKGLLHGAKKTVELWKKEPILWDMVSAYTEGINAFISSLSYKDFPVEYKLLSYEPEPWSPLKTALLLKYMADMLTGNDHDIEHTNVLNIIGEENFNLLFPDYFPTDSPVIPKGSSWNIDSITLSTIKVDSSSTYISKTIDKPDPDNGSNNWAVSGEKTESKYPILANDMHLGLKLPSIWFILQLNGPGVNVFGSSIPGSPGIITGFNDSISWGLTNAVRDLKDWYSITFKDDTRTSYLYDSTWKETTHIIEEFKIKNRRSHYDTIVFTHYGPIVYDKNFLGGKGKNSLNLALKWTAHEPSLEPLTFYKLNRAKNYNDYASAIKHYQCPPQNIVFASKQGDIAIWAQGKYINKKVSQGKFIMDGSDTTNEWQGYIPQHHNPHIKNPKRGFVSSANQIPVDSTYPYYVYNWRYEKYRNRAINLYLDSTKQITPQHMMSLQNSTYSIRPSEILPFLIDNLDSSLVNSDTFYLKVKSELENWDYYYSTNSYAAAYFELWWEDIMSLTWDELALDSIVGDIPNNYRTAHLFKYEPENKFIDNQFTEKRDSVKDIINDSFITLCQKIPQWERKNRKAITWANYKNATIEHLAKLSPFSVHNVQIGGSKDAVNANKSNWGPSWRMIVAFGPKNKAWGIYPGGQSGNPGSPYYDNFIERWRTGEYFEICFLESRSDKKEAIMFNQILNPK